VAKVSPKNLRLRLHDLFLHLSLSSLDVSLSQKQMNLTAVILNHLPMSLLRPTLESVSFADEIIIIHDSGSPHQLRPRSAIKVYGRNLRGNFAGQRNFSLTKAHSDWILFVDSDEVVPKKLKSEIQKVIKTNNYQGYYLNRQDIIFGQLLKHGETGSIKLLRLAKKNAGKFSRSVHENWNIQGRVGELKAPLLHIKNNLTNNFIKKITQYGLLDSKQLVKENKPFSYFRLIFYPPAKFILNYIVRRGMLDGLLGIFHAYLMSVQSLSVRVFQWQDGSLSTKPAKL